MKSLLSKHILASAENMCFISLGTMQKAALLLFSFTVVCSMCKQKHKICSYRRTNYLISDSKHLRSGCLRGSDLCWSQPTATVTLGNSSACAANLIPFQQPRVTAIPLSGQFNPTLTLTMEGRM